jgi:hypothetical protein
MVRTRFGLTARATIVLVIILVGIVSVAAIAYVDLNQPAAKTVSSSSGGAASSTGNASSSSSSFSSSTSLSAIPMCDSALSQPKVGDELVIPPGQSLDICVRFYAYSKTPLVLSLTNQILISGVHQDDALSNFTVSYTTAAPQGTSSVQIGGPSNESEGFLMMISITPKTGPGFLSGGTYEMNFYADLAMSGPGSGNTVGSIQGPIEVEGCPYEFSIVFGNGVPNYTTAGGCTLSGGADILIAAIVGATTQ